MQRFKFRLLPALAAAALALSACESSRNMTAPAPAESAFHTVSGPVHAVVKAPGTFVTQDDGAWANAGVIGAAGGALSIGPLRLTVPAGVVPNGTVFTMALSRANIFQVNLTATSANAAPGSNDIGRAGFRGAVYLSLDYGAQAPPSFTIAWVTSSGLVAVPTRIEGRFVIGELTHFSEYILAESILVNSEYVLGEK